MKNIILLLSVSVILTISPVISYVYSEDEGEGEYLGEYSQNSLDPDSTSNSIGQYGSKISPKSINNPIGEYGSSISSHSVNNSLATDTPKLYSQDGKYLGKVSSNTLDPDSISNPIGRYGSSISPDSVNNPIGRYGSKISPESANNPLATKAPRIIYDGDND
ncbi:MAG: hypothetical protein WCI77_06950 [Candidatus Omnitrophota bacterium]